MDRQDTLAAPLSPGPTHRRLAELPGNGQPTRALSSNIVLLEETLPPGTREKQDTATREEYQVLVHCTCPDATLLLQILCWSLDWDFIKAYYIPDQHDLDGETSLFLVPLTSILTHVIL